MRLTTQIEGMDVVRKRFRDLADIAPKVAGQELWKFVNAIKTDAQTAIKTGPKTGRIYGSDQDKAKFTLNPTKRNAAKLHQASAPGEAPASLTGNLVGSVTADTTDDGLKGYVFVNVPYAARLEFGDHDATGHIAARPFLFPALRRQTVVFLASLKAALKSATRRL